MSINQIRVRRRAGSPSASPLPTAGNQPSPPAAKPDQDPVLRWTEARGLRIESLSLDLLQPPARQTRSHSRKQIHQVAASIRQFGFLNPLLIDGERRIVAGYGRLLAARSLGYERLPCIQIDHLSEAELRLYAIADNRLAELSGWDRPLLALEFEYLNSLDLDFSLELSGFAMAEIDLMLDELRIDDGASADDEVPPPAIDRPATSQVGDFWHLGTHRLLCADARDRASFERLFGQERAQMAFTDPPYNVPVNGHVRGLGRTKFREFVMAAGEMSENEFIALLKATLGNLVQYSVDGAIHFVCMDWRHQYELLVAGRAVYTELKNLCVWNKTNAGMGTFYRSKHELIYVYKVGTAPHINNFGLGETGRYRTNVWDHAGVNAFHRERDEDLELHATPKPVALVADAIRDCSRRKGIIADAFVGSGTTLIAAERTGRRGYGLELDPHYVDVAVQRWQRVTGRQATHAETGLTFDQVAAQRQTEAATLKAHSNPEAGHGDQR